MLIDAEYWNGHANRSESRQRKRKIEMSLSIKRMLNSNCLRYIERFSVSIEILHTDDKKKIIA